MSETTQQAIERLTAQLGDFADSPSNVSGAVVAHDPASTPQRPWRLYDDTEQREFATVAELEQAVSDYVSAMRSA